MDACVVFQTKAPNYWNFKNAYSHRYLVQTNYPASYIFLSCQLWPVDFLKVKDYFFKFTKAEAELIDDDRIPRIVEYNMLSYTNTNLLFKSQNLPVLFVPISRTFKKVNYSLIDSGIEDVFLTKLLPHFLLEADIFLINIELQERLNTKPLLNSIIRMPEDMLNKKAQFLGDAYLDLVLSLHQAQTLFNSKEHKSKANNDYLTKLCLTNQLQMYLVDTENMYKRHVFGQKPNEYKLINLKTLANFLEGIIGSCLIQHGINNSLFIFEKLGIVSDMKSFSEFAKQISLGPNRSTSAKNGQLGNYTDHGIGLCSVGYLQIIDIGTSLYKFILTSQLLIDLKNLELYHIHKLRQIYSSNNMLRLLSIDLKCNKCHSSSSINESNMLYYQLGEIWLNSGCNFGSVEKMFKNIYVNHIHKIEEYINSIV